VLVEEIAKQFPRFRKYHGWSCWLDFQHTTNIMGVGSKLILVLACTIN
jgi:SRSO17 transposase